MIKKNINEWGYLMGSLYVSTKSDKEVQVIAREILNNGNLVGLTVEHGAKFFRIGHVSVAPMGKEKILLHTTLVKFDTKVPVIVNLYFFQNRIIKAMGNSIWFYLATSVLFLLLVFYLFRRYITNFSGFGVEDSVKERQLKFLEKRAKWAELATEILHSIKNLLNSMKVRVSGSKDRQEREHLDEFKKINDKILHDKAQFNKIFKEEAQGKLLIETYESIRENWEKLLNDRKKTWDFFREHIELMIEIVTQQQENVRKGIKLEETGLCSIIDSVLNDLIETYPLEGVKVEKDFQNQSDVPVQKHYWVEIFQNLFRNAFDSLKSMPPDTRNLKVSVQDHDNFYIIKISDTGEGIDPKVAASLFSFGFSTKKEGHGFGLHHCQQTLKKMGGMIEASSDGKGKGAVFTIYYPHEKDKKVS